MNKIFPSLLLALFYLVACNNEEKATFTLSGTVKDKNVKELYISHLSLKETTRTDTITLDENRKYSCQLKAEAPELYFIQAKAGQQLIFFMGQNGDALTLDIEQIAQEKNYTISGNKHCQILQELDKHSQDVLHQLVALNKDLSELQTTDKQDTVKISIEQQITKIHKDYKKYLTDFIDRYTGSSPAVIQALVQRLGREPIFNISIDRKLFEKVDDSLFVAFPASSMVQELHERLAQITPPPEAGSRAPAINLKTPEGNFFPLDSLRGKYVWLEFWASWCPDCRKTNPEVLAIFEKFKKRNFTIYQVSLDKNKEEWIQGIKADGLSAWHHVSDLKYWDCVPAREYGIRFIPAGFLIDPEGKIINRFLSPKELEEKLHEIFDK
ncbi:MAG: hypothetical protein CSB06_02070 [Bacteroidia bacterium]|nr:MAG: hypothetical protein CSB06_02070 [Bacteroidia bacterium]